MPSSETIGTIAGALTTIAFIPQVIQVWRSKSAHDISLVTFTMFSIGVAMWLLFGCLINSVAVIITNAITLFLALVILLMKIRYSGPSEDGQSSSKLPNRERR
jgi:MtN3 and saliva related transmembrane protein